LQPKKRRWKWPCGKKWYRHMKHQFDSSKTFGPYGLLERIGRGATATVYKARRQSDDRVVALKMGARLLSVDEASFARFKREFTIIRNIRHPNLVEALDFGEVNHVPYLILERNFILDKPKISRIL